MPQIKTVVELRHDLLDVFEGLRDGTLAAKEAKEMNNAAGKIINSVKVQLEYAALRNESPDIPFLNGSRNAPNS